ncbi:iron-containing alcohol dehydrogenase [Pseudomonas aeruginosa]|uniref:iron-containing alcohol dehydrogenase n=1 Tax=Pseudomonas aeruginosa TaxID=287 RepID=UPI00114F197B|nr:iron-containing alcohol dehydrogenase [Pseudomonas aeruginosa]TQI33203.1 iron-containing alcohol dehydrogenase [Pseudomonas aeruginosa]
MPSSIVLPRIMSIGADACKELPVVMTTLGCRRPFLVTDKMMVQLGYAELIQDALAQVDIRLDVFDGTVPEPTIASILAGVERVRNGTYDCIIALGGGSPIDSAKAIGILAKHGGAMRDYQFPRIIHEAGLPIIAIPTTAGTGSEVTRFTIITDETNDEKMLCVGMGFMPVAALIDYRFTLSLPPRITADTGIDALTHAIEAYVSRKANPYSDAQALTAMGLIGRNLRRVYADGNDKSGREAMMLGSTLAGIAFSNSSVALVHGMSRPIGAFFHIPHGLSNAMLLPAVTRFSIPGAVKRYADCARAIGVASRAASDDSATRKLLHELTALNEELQVPTLKQFGIAKDVYFDRMEVMADQALASGSPGNNPRIPTAKQVVDLYEQLW